jgi:hypothetical protein
VKFPIDFCDCMNTMQSLSQRRMNMKEGMKAITFRVPDEIADWLRDRAALETIKQKRQVSINGMVMDMLKREMAAHPVERKEG